ncbi:MAG: hypothetical protein A3J37_08985 [Alphaproteobacteria bacterium RIFCSPHIGHO2_12_FULL_45_9]|nr:MAG: hypothetical protein A3B66_09455 [Alphaproteobacteria bacterium RIFCSPHIGHO2_02_FULL_46_13]OFW95124.1 MAG: hypothetical protein A3J37_08985 [Alphaproteobacteria bacterium RIFCSPHIGHO2_12_FULL_45_9]
MKYSVANSTVEAFSKKAGLPVKNGEVTFFKDRFEVSTEIGNFISKFHEGNSPVAKFYKEIDSGSVKFLTREEAVDLMAIIHDHLEVMAAMHTDLAHFKNQSTSPKAAYSHLLQNLPNLGFAKETPYAQYQPPLSAPNARNWAWALKNE